MIKIILVVLTVILPDGTTRTAVNAIDTARTFADCRDIIAPQIELKYTNLIKSALDVHTRCVTIKLPQQGSRL